MFAVLLVKDSDPVLLALKFVFLKQSAPEECGFFRLISPSVFLISLASFISSCFIDCCFLQGLSTCALPRVPSRRLRPSSVRARNKVPPPYFFLGRDYLRPPGHVGSTPPLLALLTFPRRARTSYFAVRSAVTVLPRGSRHPSKFYSVYEFHLFFFQVLRRRPLCFWLGCQRQQDVVRPLNSLLTLPLYSYDPPTVPLGAFFFLDLLLMLPSFFIKFRWLLPCTVGPIEVCDFSYA